MNVYALWGLFIALSVIANIPALIHLLRSSKMALNFSALQAQASDVAANAQALQTQAANSDDASNQAVIDAVTASLTSANATLSALVVPPPAPQ